MFYNDGGALTIKDLTMTKGRAIVNLGELSIVNSAFSHNPSLMVLTALDVGTYE